MTSPVSGGLVSIEDGDKKSEEYAPARKVRVELKFDIEPGIDGQDRLEVVAAIADAQVNTLLKRPGAKSLYKGVTDQNSAQQEAAIKEGSPAKVEKPIKALKAPKGEKSDKEKLAEAAGVAGADTTIINSPARAPVEDELDGFLNGGEAAAEPISDKSMLDAIKAVNTSAKMAPRIKEVIFAFCPREDKAGFRVSDIAQEHRPRFLEKLKELPTD